MRIIYLVTTLGVGGAEKQVVALAERMAAKGHAVALIVLKHANEEWPIKATVLRLNIRKTPLGILSGLRFAKKFVFLYRPDILHSHTFPANLFTRLLLLTMRSEKATPKVVNTIHNIYEGGSHRMLLYRLTTFLTDAVTAVSSAAAERFVKLKAVPARKISVLTNGIDTDAVIPNKSRRKHARVQMNAKDNFIWLAVGRLAPAKDYPNLLHAFDQVRNVHSNAELWIAGEGDPATILPSQPGQMESQQDPENSAKFLGLRRDVVELLDAADGFVLSSAWEGMPLAVAEAMAMEKQIVATDIGGVRELVADCGILVPVKDSNALADAMLKVMSMDGNARKIQGSAARQRIKLHFSMNAKADQWEMFYDSLIKERTT